MDKKKETMVRKIEYLKETICHCENNLQYSNDEIYRKYFYSDKGHSFFDRICLSITDYQYGNKPFNY